jgi:hypothetical protein
VINERPQCWRHLSLRWIAKIKAGIGSGPFLKERY